MKHFHSAQHEILRNVTRRHFLGACATGLGSLWWATQGRASVGAKTARDPRRPVAPLAPHFTPRARRVIYLHMTGAPSQFELFDYKPELARLDGQDCPKEYVEGKRFAFIRGIPQLLGPVHPFHPESKTGLWISDQLPFIEQHMDKLCFVHSMQTDQFNHAPAQLLVHTGNQNLGYASFGSWVLYGLGSENENMPGYVVLLSGGQNPDAGKAAWGSGYLPSVYQGVQCRSVGDPVLYLSNPPGITRDLRGSVIDAVTRLNQQTYEAMGDPETITRIAQYELAFRMQTEATDAMDIRLESPETLDRYGAAPGSESFANNCLLARRLVERGVRFVQLFDWGWDTHGTGRAGSVDVGLAGKCKEVDQATGALLGDLEQRGMLDDTLVIWGGEFGRTPMRENRGGTEMPFRGRDHHSDAFTLWMAGGGVKPGFSYGETDPIGYSVTKDPVQVRDLHATLLHLLGLNFEQLTYPFQGLNQKLTGVRKAGVVEGILA